MLKIRLQRIGRRKQPTYRLIVSEKQRDTQYGSLEILGQYNPILKEKKFDFKEDRVKHWLSVGAQPSETVHNLLIAAGILSGAKAKSVFISKIRRAKIDTKHAQEAEKKKSAEAARVAQAEAANAKGEEETPGEAPQQTSDETPAL